jgi:hypothetical protein
MYPVVPIRNTTLIMINRIAPWRAICLIGIIRESLIISFETQLYIYSEIIGEFFKLVFRDLFRLNLLLELHGKFHHAMVVEKNAVGKSGGLRFADA